MDDDGWGEPEPDAQPAQESKQLEKADSETPNPESATQPKAYVSTTPTQTDDQPIGNAELIPANIPPATSSQSINTVSNTTAAIPTPMADETEVAKAMNDSPPIAQVSPAYERLTLSIIFVPMLVSCGIFLLLWSVINGWFERLIF